MKEIEINSWDEFPNTIDQIRREYGEHEAAGIKEKNLILYRGQADYKWHLESTLERFSSSSWKIESYYHLALRCAPQIESFTDTNWNLPQISVIEAEIEKNPDMYLFQIPCYEFLVYLRHNGFPSPLLDWTVSPYIGERGLVGSPW